MYGNFTSISTKFDAEVEPPNFTISVISLNIIGSGLTDNCKLGLVRSGGGALSSLNKYMTNSNMLMFTAGVIQVRLVLFTMVHGD